jgi:hypothetical protein
MEEKKIYPVCKRCGRRLRSDEAKERGMGKVCWEKSQHISSPKLFYVGGHKDVLPKDN